jgi:hypothetical protein
LGTAGSEEAPPTAVIEDRCGRRWLPQQKSGGRRNPKPPLLPSPKLVAIALFDYIKGEMNKPCSNLRHRIETAETGMHVAYRRLEAFKAG